MKTLYYPATFLAVLWTLTLVFAAIAKGVTERHDLEARLPVSHPVFCADSKTEWADLTASNFLFSAVAYTWMEGPQAHEMYFSADTCVALADTDSKAFPDAAETLYHEWFHAELMTRDEGETECLSLFIYRYALRHYWGFSRPEAQRAYKSAFAAHTRLGLRYPSYMGECRYPQGDPVL